MPVKPHQIERWALDIIERVNAGQPSEDFRVELKAKWIQPQKAARQIAGHANAARGTPILWLMGVDEELGVIGVESNELANWISQVKAQFDGLSPALTDINIPIDDKTVVALYFETDRIPFVVKNPAHGNPGGGSVSLEVPWREGTSTVSAKHSNLIKILSPITNRPDVEVLKADLESSNQTENGDEVQYLHLSLNLYIEPPETERIVIPIHRCSAEIDLPGLLNHAEFHDLSIDAPTRFILNEFRSEPASKTIDTTRDEIIVYGPGKVYLNASMRLSPFDNVPKNDALISVRLLPTNSEIPVGLNLTFKPTPSDDEKTYSWLHVKNP